MKKYIIFALLISTLSGCTSTKEASVKIPERESVMISSWQVVLGGKYIGYVQWIEQSGVGPKTGWRVISLEVQEGDRVKKWQVLAKLSNQEGLINYNGLGNVMDDIASMKRSTTVTKNNTVAMRKTLTDLYDTQIEQAEIGVKNLQVSLDQAKKNLGNQTGTLDSGYHFQANSFTKLADSVLYQGDRILGITTNFEYSNDAWEPYLGTRIGNIKSEAENQWNKLYAARWSILAKEKTLITETNAKQEIEELKASYQTLNDMINTMCKMLENSVVGWGLPQDMLDAWIAQWYGFKSSEWANEATFLTWKDGVASLMDTSGSWDTSVASMSIETLSSQIESAKKNVDLLKAEKENKLKELNVNISQIDGKSSELDMQLSQTAMNQALAWESIDGATVVAPFDGVVVQKLTSVWQMIDVGTPVFLLATDDTIKIIVYIWQADQWLVHAGDTVNIQTDSGTVVEAKVFNVQPTVDIATKKIPVEIHIKNTDHKFLIWSYVSVIFWWKSITWLTIPYRFVDYSYGDSSINVLDTTSQTIKRVPVTLSACSDIECVISWDVQEGQSILRP